MEQIIEKKLSAFITDKFRVSSQKISFYITWIKKYISFKDKNDIKNNAHAKFLKFLSSYYKDWQLEQAERAIIIYRMYINQNEETSSWRVKFLL